MGASAIIRRVIQFCSWGTVVAGSRVGMMESREERWATRMTRLVREDHLLYSWPFHWPPTQAPESRAGRENSPLTLHSPGLTTRNLSRLLYSLFIGFSLTWSALSTTKTATLGKHSQQGMDIWMEDYCKTVCFPPLFLSKGGWDTWAGAEVWRTTRRRSTLVIY